MTGLLEWSSSLLILLVRLLAVLWKGYGGQGGSEVADGEETGRRPGYLQRGSGEIPGEVRTGVEGCGLGKLPGHGAEPLHVSAEA